MAFENEKACHTVRPVIAGFQNHGVQLGGEQINDNQHSLGLQPVSAPIYRVIARLERRFALSSPHARIIAELAYPGVMQ